MLGSLSCIKLGDKYGRIKTIIAGNIVNVFGSIILVSSFSFAQLVVGRIVLGLGLGAIVATVPAWQAESSLATHRGRFVVLEGTFPSLGLVAFQFIDLGCFFDNTSFSWRFPLAIPLLFNFLMLSTIPFLPESPRWLVKKGRIEEAVEILAILDDVSPDSPRIAEGIRHMQRSLETMSQGSMVGILRDKENKMKFRTLVCLFITFYWSLNGAGLIGFYTVPIFSSLGVSAIIARVLSGSMYAWQVPCCMLAYLLVDRLGRRFLLLLGAAGMGIVFVIMAVCVSLVPANKAAMIIAAVAMYGFGFFYSMSLGVNWLYPTEITPLGYSTQIYALSTASQFALTFMVVEVSPIGITNLGWKYFIVFAAINLGLLFPVVYLFFPETTGHSLEDMDVTFRTPTGPFGVVKASKHVRQDTVLHPSGEVEVQDLEMENERKVGTVLEIDQV
ncbi:hypothetical protein, variant [Exophiala oligosperma]|nr:hypothetical protein, variant [Exophiala oligosperma]KIW35969.1 hypothetical protein, variant [Exophiala oligosperma]